VRTAGNRVTVWQYREDDHGDAVAQSMTGPRTRVVLAMSPGLPARLFGPRLVERLAAAVDVDGGAPLGEYGSAAARARLAGAQVLLTGWGAPMLDESALDQAPLLRAVVHAAGTVKPHVATAAFERGIAVSSAADANALPVAEYTVAMILLANKAVPQLAREYRSRRARLDLLGEFAHIGNYGRTVGLVGASRVGRRVLELLAPFDLDLLVSDPYLDAEAAGSLGARLVGLDELFARSDVVSLHAPAVPATRGLVDAGRLASMRTGATLINTARGSLVDQDALIAQLRSGRITAVLDVTEPEITAADSPLWELPNVILTPHVAGALGNELFRLGASAVEEVLRVAAGEPLRHPVDPATLAITA
jgi:phosphoglycerate dehydrogenase-like enzyme